MFAEQSIRRTFLWLILIALAVTVAITLARHDTGNPSGQDFASLLIRVSGLVLIGGAAIAMFRDNFAQAVKSALIWFFIALVLVVGYTYRFELKDASNRVMAELMPGRAATKGRTVELARLEGGDFQISTQVNGRQVGMVLDTGASSVVLTNEAAKAAGLPLEMIKYTVNVETANGRTRAAAVTLDRLAVGGIVERGVSALIAQPGQLKTSLLGMSFLNRLQGWEVRGDKLVMRGYP
ncbi:MAG: TIGR02281 family clan AA aspartic protease [Xanthobacteraceae bacterium]